eukprot:scaffold30252_cov78-Skeletonema_dohrnii-CCMP3373.AAC.1
MVMAIKRATTRGGGIAPALAQDVLVVSRGEKGERKEKTRDAKVYPATYTYLHDGAQNTYKNSPAAIAALTCNETDALLQVKYTITKDEWDSSRPIFDKPFLYLQGNELRYKNFAKLKDYEECLPRDECSEVVVGGIPTDAYEISFDGKAVDIGHEFVFDGKNPVTSTEVGTCTKPICKDTEALLDIQYWSGYYNYNQHSFRVEDKEGNTVLHGEPEGRYSVNRSAWLGIRDVKISLPRKKVIHCVIISSNM